MNNRLAVISPRDAGITSGTEGGRTEWFSLSLSLFGWRPRTPTSRITVWSQRERRDLDVSQGFISSITWDWTPDESKDQTQEQAWHTNSLKTASGEPFALAHLRVSCKNTDLQRSTAMNALYTVRHRASGSLNLLRLWTGPDQDRATQPQRRQTSLATGNLAALTKMQD